MDYFGDGSKTSPATGRPFGVHIEYYFEKEPLGNAGALFTCEKVFGYSQKNAEGWFKALKKKYPLYKGESGKIEDALAQRIAFAEELRRDGAKYGLVFSR